MPYVKNALLPYQGPHFCVLRTDMLIHTLRTTGRNERYLNGPTRGLLPLSYVSHTCYFLKTALSLLPL